MPAFQPSQDNMWKKSKRSERMLETLKRSPLKNGQIIVVHDAETGLRVKIAVTHQEDSPEKEDVKTDAD